MQSNRDISKTIKRTIKGDAVAQRSLYDTYRVRWFMICLRYMSDKHDAEDAMQNGLVQVFMKLSQFDIKKGSFSAWSSKVMVNECLMQLRKKNSTAYTSNIETAYDHYDESESAEDMLSTEELMNLVRKLPSGYRTVFNLYAIEGFTHHEISEKLNISVGTSKSQLFKARKMLQKAFMIIMS